MIVFTSAVNAPSVVSAIREFSTLYGGSGVITGSASLFLRGIWSSFDDIDIIVPGLTELEIIRRAVPTEDILTSNTKELYQLNFTLGGYKFETWRETGTDLPIPAITKPEAYDLLLLRNAILPVRPLKLLLSDYKRATQSDYDPGKHDAYAAKIMLLKGVIVSTH